MHENARPGCMGQPCQARPVGMHCKPPADTPFKKRVSHRVFATGRGGDDTGLFRLSGLFRLFRLSRMFRLCSIFQNIWPPEDARPLPRLASIRFGREGFPQVRILENRRLRQAASRNPATL